MKTLFIDSKISDVLCSVELFEGERFVIVRKDNGELVELFSDLDSTSKSIYFKSLVSNQLYYVCVYHRSNGRIVKRLKRIKEDKKDGVLKNINNFCKRAYYRILFSNITIEKLEFTNYSNSYSFVFDGSKNFVLKYKG